MNLLLWTFFALIMKEINLILLIFYTFSQLPERFMVAHIFFFSFPLFYTFLGFELSCWFPLLVSNDWPLKGSLWLCVCCDKTSKRGPAGRKAATWRVWPSRVLSEFVSFPRVTARQAGVRAGRTTWHRDVARCCVVTHTVICFVMVVDSTIKSVSDTLATGPEVTQSLEKDFCLSSFVSPFASARITST